MPAFHTKTLNCVNYIQKGNCKSIRSLGGSIIALAKYWCSSKNDDIQNSLHFMLPSNINLLPVQITEVLLEIEFPETVV
jgi:hypothetical protein